MHNGFSAYGDLDSEGNFNEDYEETPIISKKDWFKPASASLARLDKIKPVATVYNLGLRDPRDLQAGRGKPAPVPVPPVNNQLSELPTEPPLSTVSYQKAAWGSQTSIPELLKQAAQAGTKPTRPSSAKTGSISKVPQGRKVRPQSAKDPLCPPGKRKNGSTFGIKGHKFDPVDKYRVPPGGSCAGWAGPPAGLRDPTNDVFCNSLPSSGSEGQRSQVPPPPPPHTSPEPDHVLEEPEHYSPPPSPMCLSLSLPSADVDASDDMETSRLLEQADNYVKTQKKKESQKMRYFNADQHSPRKIGEALKMSLDLSQQRSPHVSESARSQESVNITGNDLKLNTSPKDGDFEDVLKNLKGEEGLTQQEDINRNNAAVDEHISVEHPASDLTLDLEARLDDGELETTLPPSNGFDLEYLGPAMKERKNRSHPIFLMPDKKPGLHRELQPSEHGSKPQNDHRQSGTHQEKAEGVGKEKKREPTTHCASNQSGAVHSTMPRSGVHIREDCNVTVDITPRNMGRKVTGKSARRNRAGNNLCDFELRNDWSEKSRSSEGERAVSGEETPKLEVTTMGTKIKPGGPVGGPVTSAASVTVVYDDDDDDDDSQTFKKKKTRRHRSAAKEKDVVTMVSNLSLSDDDENSDADDPSQEVDLHIGSSSDRSHGEMGRSSSTLSGGERNYYDIARKQTKDDPARLEEKENFITMTTKTLLFDLEKPKESVVKTILDAPLGKSKHSTGCSSPDKLDLRPKSANQPKSANRLKSASQPKSAKLSKSDLHSVRPVDSPHLTPHEDDGNDEDGGFTTSIRIHASPDEERPESRMGFISMETDPAVRSDEEDGRRSVDGKVTKLAGGISRRPPSGRRRPLSAASKTLNRPPSAALRHRQNARDSGQGKRRPRSASSMVSDSPSAADVQRANAAAQALRAQRETAANRTTVTSRFSESRRQYASYSKGGGRTRAQSASLYRRPVEIKSINPDLEVDDTEAMEECQEIHNRLACYGIDVKPQTLERALFPPSGRTLYYQLDAQLPSSYSAGLLSHPRYWLPEEHRKLKIAEKKLAMAELSLWQQKKEEERKARLAAKKEKTPKKGKKKGKKKLRRSQSIC